MQISARRLGLGLAFAVGMIAWTAPPGLAHGPSRQKATASVVLAAPPDEVFAVVGDFSDMGWYPGVTDTQVSEDGKARVLVLEDGTEIPERLAKQDEEKRVISFRRTADDLAVIPATNFSSQIEVADEGGKAKVTWTSAFYRGFPNNDPPPELDDAAAMAAGEAFIARGLAALIARFGAGG